MLESVAGYLNDALFVEFLWFLSGGAATFVEIGLVERTVETIETLETVLDWIEAASQSRNFVINSDRGTEEVYIVDGTCSAINKAITVSIGF